MLYICAKKKNKHAILSIGPVGPSAFKRVQFRIDLCNSEMGFDKVYKSLQEVFPQIDTRVLRAVAIEHTKDADAAVEAVLTEIIPFFIERSRPSTLLSGSISVGPSSEVPIGGTSNTQIANGPSIITVGATEPQHGYAMTVGGQQSFHGAGTSNAQTADGPSVNTVGSVEIQHGYTVTEGGQQSFHSANDGNDGPIYDTYDGHLGGECNTSDGNNENTHQVDGLENLQTHEEFFMEKFPESGIKTLSDNVKTLQNDGSEDLQTREEFFAEKFHESVIKMPDNVNTLQIDGSENLQPHEEFFIEKFPGSGIKVLTDNVNTLQIDGLEDLQTHETFVLDKFPESGIKMLSGNIPRQTLDALHDFDVGTSQNVNILQETADSGDLETELSATANKENEHEKSLDDGKTSVVGAASLSGDDQLTNAHESSVQLGVLPEIHRSDLEQLDARLSNDTGCQVETGSSTVHSEDANLNDFMSQASQTHIIEVLEQAIAEARNSKTTLFSTMQSVMNMVREVELKEQAAEQAKVEAAMGGNDILVKVEELKQMIQHAKEANSMHAGEVYGEKSILASELRELQSRVLSLSDERDKSLSVLDEMHHALEVRLVEAENEIKSAEQSKVEKDKAAMKALADEELIMEKVVEESKILKQQAEENAKLQEFLVDRGRIVDMLQGEIAVICQDVLLLKDKFDNKIPLSKSVSSSSSCTSASFSSSLNDSTPKEIKSVPNGTSDLLESTETTDQGTALDEQSSGEKVAKDDVKALIEDGWELFDGNETFG